MDGVAVDRLVTDAVLLDAVEGLDSIASRLADAYDRVAGGPKNEAEVANDLAGVLADLGWWCGRLQGAVSAETAAAVEQLASDDA
jgi:hypothetical protein